MSAFSNWYSTQYSIAGVYVYIQLLGIKIIRMKYRCDDHTVGGDFDWSRDWEIEHTNKSALESDIMFKLSLCILYTTERRWLYVLVMMGGAFSHWINTLAFKFEQTNQTGTSVYSSIRCCRCIRCIRHQMNNNQL